MRTVAAAGNCCSFAASSEEVEVHAAAKYKGYGHYQFCRIFHKLYPRAKGGFIFFLSLTSIQGAREN